MVQKIVVLCSALLVASPVAAGTIVTWQGDGMVAANYSSNPSFVVPPVGTPVSVTLSFDPGSAAPTPAGSPGCMRVSVSGSMSLGSYDYSIGSGSLGFTHAQLPGTNCVGSIGGFTQFSIHDFTQPADAPWNLTGGPIILSYRDLLVQDAFPNEPTMPDNLASLWFDNLFLPYGFRGPVTLVAVEQPAAVPEPGTLTLFGLGLAAVARRVRRKTVG